MLGATVTLLLLIAGAWALAPWRAGRRKPLLVIASGDTQGWLTPCGCTSNQSGGLPRRGSFLLQRAQQHDVIYVDAGGAIDGDSPYHVEKFKAILRGERLAGGVAHNIGAAEIKLGIRTLRDIETATGVCFVSCNATDAATQVRLGTELQVITRQGRRIGITGVVSPGMATATTLVQPPRDALLRLVRGGGTEKYDVLMVLAYLPETELEELVAAVPEVHIFLGGPTGQSLAPRKVGAATVAAATRQGKFMVEIPLDQAGGGAVTELSAVWPDDPRQIQNVARFRAELGARDFPATQAGLVRASAAPGVGYVGSAACGMCHGEEFTAWSRSGHGHAWESLTRKGAQVDPACQVCHTTGYGQNAGFVSAKQSPARVNVGCEDCHGPGAAHVKNAKQRPAYLASGQCIRCHDAENSPHFAYAKYWEKIKHGSRKAEKR